MTWPHISFIPRYAGHITWPQGDRFFGYERGVNWFLLRAGRSVLTLTWDPVDGRS